ncbi:VCBS domain-containing protein, partial [Desulfobacterales bacterium]|nr:VCBS domain-containing protein [Desulfobacterales bacterium]
MLGDSESQELKNQLAGALGSRPNYTSGDSSADSGNNESLTANPDLVAVRLKDYQEYSETIAELPLPDVQVLSAVDPALQSSAIGGDVPLVLTVDFDPNDLVVIVPAAVAAAILSRGSLIETATVASNLEVDNASFVSGEFTGSVNEDAAVNTISGTLQIFDVDGFDNPFFANVTSTLGDQGYGFFILNDETWTYTLDNNNNVVNALGLGEQITDTITFTASDGTTQSVIVSISGENDAPVITAITVNERTDDDASYTINLLSTASDVDTSDVLSVIDGNAFAIDANGTSVSIPEEALNRDGETLRINPTAFDGLTLGESVTITYAYNITDGISVQSNIATFSITANNALIVELSKDGIPPDIEDSLAELAGDTGGDLNNDGIPDSEQASVAIAAWGQKEIFEQALAGELNESTPIISISVGNPSGVSDSADIFYQLEGVQVLDKNDDSFGGSLPVFSDINGETITSDWDPISFKIGKSDGATTLEDSDPSREGTQIVLTIDISRFQLNEGEFNGYRKFVSEDAINNGSSPLVDLDGNPITNSGWYDFTQRQDDSGNYVGDGARFITEQVNGQSIISRIQLTFTDNQFGDNNRLVE